MTPTADDQFDLTKLRQLATEAQTFARQLTAAHRPDARHHGYDTSKTVRVALNGHGHLLDIEIGSSWRDTVGIDHLGPAIIEATAAARQRSFEDWARAVEESAEGPDVEPRGTGYDSSYAAVPPPSGSAALEAMNEMFYLAMDVTSKLAEISSQTDDQAEPPAAVGRSAGGRVTVTMQAGTLSRIEFQPGWLRSAATETIAQHTQAACEAAHVMTQTPELQGRAFDELRDAMSDPLALLRRLGLHPHPQNGPQRREDGRT